MSWHGHTPLFQEQISDDHAVIRLASGDGTAADGGEVPGGVDLVEAEDRDAAVKGIAPASADTEEGIVEVAFDEALDGIRGRGIEVACENDGLSGGEGGRVFEDLEGHGDLKLTLLAVLFVVSPTLPLPEPKVGGCRR